MTWPQIIALGLLALQFLVHGYDHGKPREAYNGFVGMFDVALWAGLLWWGGFWS